MYNYVMIYCYTGIKAKQNGMVYIILDLWKRQMLPEVHLVHNFIILNNFMSDSKGNNLQSLIN